MTEMRQAASGRFFRVFEENECDGSFEACVEVYLTEQEAESGGLIDMDVYNDTVWNLRHGQDEILSPVLAEMFENGEWWTDELSCYDRERGVLCRCVAPR